MTARPYRPGPLAGPDPVVHELAPLRLADQLIGVHLLLRRDEAGTWRARLRYIDATLEARETAEIFCGGSEPELWESVRSLPQHHLRALYLSLG
ncbi:MAG TPA: hypothetical protein VHR43_02780 [Gemmatimonadales bacterium]|jgi:hypothetical protein|nr:hypothetical protein [Gemmatimonadales bacterium]